MTKRLPYAGDAGLLGGGNPSIPMQAETAAYLARFSGAISAGYKNALNEFVYKTKKAGVLSLFQDLWLFVADTQADALRNFVSASRDATLGGALTFTANRGFSGSFTAVNLVSMPYSTTGVGTSSGTAFSGAIGSTGSAVNQIGTSSTKVGAVATNSAFNSIVGGTGALLQVTGSGRFVTQGGASSSMIAADGQLTGSAPTGIEASPLVTQNTTTMLRLCALGIAPTITANQMQVFLAALNQLMTDVGATP